MIARRFQVHSGNSLDIFSKPWKRQSQILGMLSNILQKELGRNFLFFYSLITRKKMEMLSLFWRKIWPCCACDISYKIRPFTPPLSNSNHMESLSIRSRASWVNEGTTHSTPVAFITFYRGAKSKKYGLWYRFRLESQLVHSNFCIVKHISHNSCIYPGFE